MTKGRSVFTGYPWRPANYMKRPPEYSFEVEGVRIEMWKGYGVQFISKRLEAEKFTLVPTERRH